MATKVKRIPEVVFVARKRKGRRCSECRKRRKIVTKEWCDEKECSTSPDFDPDWKPKVYCMRCFRKVTLRELKQSKIESAKRDIELAKAAKEAQALAYVAAQTRRKVENETRAKFKKVKRAISLSTEGNLGVMQRLLIQKKTDKQILETFREMYRVQGKTDEKWIKARVNTYKRIVKENM